MQDRPESDLARRDRIKEEDIDYSDIPPLDEPGRYRVVNPLPPSKLEWLKQQRLRVVEVFRTRCK